MRGFVGLSRLEDTSAILLRHRTYSTWTSEVQAIGFRKSSVASYVSLVRIIPESTMYVVDLSSAPTYCDYVVDYKGRDGAHFISHQSSPHPPNVCALLLLSLLVRQLLTASFKDESRATRPKLALSCTVGPRNYVPRFPLGSISLSKCSGRWN